jgi:hypothetical protein
MLTASVAAQRSRGERLDPATCGPAVIESMDAVLARERARPPGPEVDPRARAGRHGEWMVPARLAPRRAHSGERCAINRFGDTRMGIGFGAPVDVEGAWVAAAGVRGAFARALQVVGFRGGAEVARTAWFADIDEEPAWLAIDMARVDRIEFVALAAFEGAGWFSLDDLTFVRGVGAERQDSAEQRVVPAAQRVVIDFEAAAFGAVLTGSNYGGLTWEEGRGEFTQSEGPVPAPQTRSTLRDDADAHALESQVALAALAAPPAIVQSFAGPRQGDPGAPSYPPDTCGAVGLDHFVTAVNNAVSVYSKATGARLFTSSLDSFFGLQAGADPRVVFDPHSQRYFLITCDFVTKVHFAMSMSADPLGPWFKTSVVVSQGSDAFTWPDYPTLGVDANGLYIAAYMVGGNFDMALFAIDKAPLLSTTPAMGTITAWRNLVFEWAIQPCVTYGTPPAEYIVSRQNPTHLRLRAVLPPLSAPTLVEQGSVLVPGHADPPDVPALGGGPFIHTIDVRPINAVFRNGSVWTTHTIRNTIQRTAVRWYELDPVGITALQVGTVSDDVRSFYYPSLAVNGNGDVALGFSGSSTDEYVSAFVAGRRAIDPPSTTSLPILLKAGEGPYVQLDLGGLNRWGDYSLTSVDPVDDATIWSIQEYARENNSWGTWIAKLAPGCPGAPDCNGNGVADACDLEGELSFDHNGSGVLDECEGFDGSAFCFGDGSLATQCPCVPPDVVPSQSGAVDAGCANSFDLNGARLSVSGVTAPDSLQLRAEIAGSYLGFAYMVKGDAQSASGIVLGDGVRCVDGALVTFGAHLAGTNGSLTGEWRYPNSVQTAGVSAVTTQAAATTAFYQLVYRNAAAGFCSPATFNVSNAFRVAW